MAVINAKFRSKCRDCGKPVAVGQRVEWERKERGVSCCSGRVLRDGPRRRQGETVDAIEAARRDMERGAAALERALSRSMSHEVPVRKRAVCSECHDTHIGDDGYACTRCEGRPKLAEPVEQTPPHADDFGPMPTDDDFAAADAALSMDTEGGAS